MNTAPTPLKPRTLTRHDEISPGVFVIGFARWTDFHPGQAVKLGVDAEHPPRIYSLCGGPNDDELQVLFNIKDDGFLTPKLAEKQVGDTLYVSDPYGTFLGDEAPAWWIATGTGIAPYRSMIRAGWTANKRLVHGVRHLNQFYFADELRAALGADYHRCCSAESAEGVNDGRVTAFLENRDDLDPALKYYICGQATMAVETRDILIAKGVPFAHIITEIYF